MVATNQGMHERCVSLIRAQRELRPEGVGVAVEADAALRFEGRAEISRHAEVVVEVPVERDVKTISIETAPTQVQTRILVAAEELSLRIAPGFRRDGGNSKHTQHASQ